LYAPKSLYAPKYALKYTPDCTRLYTTSLLDLRSRVSSQDSPKYTPSTFSSTLPSMLSRTLLIALDGTLPACLTVRSQVSSQDALKHTPRTLSSTLPIALDDTPSLLGSTLPSTLSSGKTLPNSLDYMLPCMLLRARSRDLLSCRRQVPGGVRLVADGGQCLADGGRRVVCGVWRVACGRWQVAYVGRNHDVGRYGSLNLIFSATTMTRSHDASRSWC